MASAQPTKNAMELSSLTQWSQEHIRAIFESPSNEESIQAIDEIFSSDIKAILNGKQVGLLEIKQSVILMRAESSGLKVEWKQSVEGPQTCNRVCIILFFVVFFFYSFSPFFDQISDPTFILIERIIRRFLCYSQHPSNDRGRGR
jgi:hypothetical protein